MGDGDVCEGVYRYQRTSVQLPPPMRSSTAIIGGRDLAMVLMTPHYHSYEPMEGSGAGGRLQTKNSLEVDVYRNSLDYIFMHYY